MRTFFYRAGHVPVGADQVAHVEITREIARRFNHIYGREPGFEELAESACDKMGKKGAKLYRSLRRAYLENGDQESLQRAQALVKDQQNITLADRERLIGYLEGSGKVFTRASGTPHRSRQDAGARWSKDVEILWKYYRFA